MRRNDPNACVGGVRRDRTAAAALASPQHRTRGSASHALHLRRRRAAARDAAGRAASPEGHARDRALGLLRRRPGAGAAHRQRRSRAGRGHCPACDRQPALAGVRVPARPHLGTAGVAIDVAGRVSTIPPGAHGGNIDNWRIGAGAVMYYPVQVAGALFSIGDPHVSQGDGEISGTAIEASLNVLMQIIVRRDFSFPGPLLETPRHWIAHGFDEDPNVAARSAALDMLALLTEHAGLSRDDAYSLMSVAADFAVTQVVDGRQGAHVRIPRSLFPVRGAGGRA